MDWPSAVTLTDQDDEPIGEVASSVISSGPGGTWSFEYPLPARCYGRREFRVRVLVDGRELAWTEADLRLVGFLDLLGAERCGGWLCAPHAPQTRFDIEVRRNGELVGSGCASLPRPDLRDHYPTEWDIGFDITLSPSSRELDPAVLSVRLTGSQVELFEGPFLVGHRAGFIQTAREVAHLANVGKAGSPPLTAKFFAPPWLSSAPDTAARTVICACPVSVPRACHRHGGGSLLSFLSTVESP